MAAVFLDCVCFFMAGVYPSLSAHGQLSSWPPWCHQMFSLADLRHNGEVYESGRDCNVRWQMFWCIETIRSQRREKNDRKQLSENTEGKTDSGGWRRREKLVWGLRRRWRKMGGADREHWWSPQCSKAWWILIIVNWRKQGVLTSSDSDCYVNFRDNIPVTKPETLPHLL